MPRTGKDPDSRRNSPRVAIGGHTIRQIDFIANLRGCSRADVVERAVALLFAQSVKDLGEDGARELGLIEE